MIGRILGMLSYNVVAGQQAAGCHMAADDFLTLPACLLCSGLTCRAATAVECHMAKYTFLYTDSVLALQWAERLLQGGETEQWGDKWEERFKEGKGTKKVSVASCIHCSCCYRQPSVDLLNPVAPVRCTQGSESQL